MDQSPRHDVAMRRDADHPPSDGASAGIATAALPTRPEVADWRALARSAPWRWTALTVVLREYRSHAPAEDVTPAGLADRVPQDDPEPVRLHFRRGLGSPRAERLDSTLLQEEYRAAQKIEDQAVLPGASIDRWGNRNASRSVIIFSAVDDVVDPEAERARVDREELDALEHPTRRPDGLIAERPEYVPDPPMWRNYAHVSLLDPVELTDAQDPEGGPGTRWIDGTEVSDVRVVDVEGRPAWAARVIPTAHYQPRCTCCALMATTEIMVDEIGADQARELGWTGAQSDPDYAEVALDVATGVVVRLRVTGGVDDGTRYALSIERAE